MQVRLWTRNELVVGPQPAVADQAVLLTGQHGCCDCFCQACQIKCCRMQVCKRWPLVTCMCAEPEAEVPEEDEDIFQLEVQTEGMHVTQPGVASEAVEQARGEGAREGFEGALDSAPRDAGASASPSGRSAVCACLTHALVLCSPTLQS